MIATSDNGTVGGIVALITTQRALTIIEGAGHNLKSLKREMVNARRRIQKH